MAPRTQPEEIAPEVYRLSTGRGALGANVYFSRSTDGWVLIDAGWRRDAPTIQAAARFLFGANARPQAILLTHTHPDHAGSVLELARTWTVPVHVHPAEVPLLPGGYVPQHANPLDRWVIAPILRLVPRERVEAARAKGSLERVASAWAADERIPSLPDWQAVHTPGHTPGHAGFYRSSDAVLLTGDAVLTVDLNSLGGLVLAKPGLAGPPRYTTWDWEKAQRTIRLLADLKPTVLAPGHGEPLLTGASEALRALAEGISVRA